VTYFIFSAATFRGDVESQRAVTCVYVASPHPPVGPKSFVTFSFLLKAGKDRKAHDRDGDPGEAAPPGSTKTPTGSLMSRSCPGTPPRKGLDASHRGTGREAAKGREGGRERERERNTVKEKERHEQTL